MFVIARSAHRRPTLQHLLPQGVFNYTECGLDVTLWSRAYQQDPIEAVLCMRCRRVVDSTKPINR